MKKAMSVCLVLVMLLGIVPLTVHAAGKKPTAINSVYVTITSPISNKAPSYVAYTAFGGGYTISNESEGDCLRRGVCWFDADGEPLPTTHKFVFGATYTVRVALVPEDESLPFAESGVTGKINGDEADVTAADPSAPKDKIYVSYTFVCKNLINTIRIGLPEPTPGAAPCYTADYPEGVVPFRDKDQAEQINGVRWYDRTEDAVVEPGSAFIENHEYTLDLYLQADSGWAFADQTYHNTVKLNGDHGAFNVSSLYDYQSSEVLSCMFLFTCTAPQGDQPKTVTVRVQSFLDSDELVTVTLAGRKMYCDGLNATAAFYDVPDTSAALTVSKKNHVTYTEQVEITGDAELNVKIHPIGDITGDGEVTTVDYGRANSHARNKVLLSGYLFDCGDVITDGTINTADAGRINSHVRNKVRLW